MSESLLTDTVKGEIQRAYRAWLEARGFRPRRGQREMIAAVARTIAGEVPRPVPGDAGRILSGDAGRILPPDAPRILAVEAGTGTGKTAGYCLPAIPLAQALGKRVVISTATVAL